MRSRLCRSAHRFWMNRRYPAVANRLGLTAVQSGRRPHSWHIAPVLINTMKAC